MNSSLRADRPATSPPRAWVVVLPFVLAVVVLGGVYAAVAGRLPEHLATHFGPNGQADGYTSPGGYLILSIAPLAVFGIAFAVLGRRPGAGPAARWQPVVGYAMAAGLAYLTGATLLCNAGVPDAAAVRLPYWHLAVALAVALLAGGVGRLLAGPGTRSAHRAPGSEPRLDLPGGSRASWSHTVSSPLMAAVSIPVCGAGLVLGFTDNRLPGAVLLAAAVVTGALASVRVTVDRRGLALAPTLLPYPFRRIPLHRIVAATSREVVIATEFGGWGYRVQPGRSGLVLRSGEGVVLRLTSDREFVVTVDDAATAVALLNTYLDRARSK
ncbi:DUF1648 domain-containing protein [Streptomyces sp. x-80]|uniref:DUF1648 domain-containing protein n=1 Tax=Streptomyces sp. x-80 TaxID=2789282 RepID=UPI0039807BFC